MANLKRGGCVVHRPCWEHIQRIINASLIIWPCFENDFCPTIHQDIAVFTSFISCIDFHNLVMSLSVVIPYQGDISHIYVYIVNTIYSIWAGNIIKAIIGRFVFIYFSLFVCVHITSASNGVNRSLLELPFAFLLVMFPRGGSGVVNCFAPGRLVREITLVLGQPTEMPFIWPRGRRALPWLHSPRMPRKHHTCFALFALSLFPDWTVQLLLWLKDRVRVSRRSLTTLPVPASLAHSIFCSPSMLSYI